MLNRFLQFFRNLFSAGLPQPLVIPVKRAQADVPRSKGKGLFRTNAGDLLVAKVLGWKLAADGTRYFTLRRPGHNSTFIRPESDVFRPDTFRRLNFLQNY